MRGSIRNKRQCRTVGWAKSGTMPGSTKGMGHHKRKDGKRHRIGENPALLACKPTDRERYFKGRTRGLFVKAASTWKKPWLVSVHDYRQQEGQLIQREASLLIRSIKRFSILDTRIHVESHSWNMPCLNWKRTSLLASIVLQGVGLQTQIWKCPFCV